MEIFVDNMEDLCGMMCDNIVPKEKEQWWIFTFGGGQKHEGYYCRVYGTFHSARQKMIDRHGKEWAFQYTLKEWNDWLERKPSYLPEETLLEEIN